MGERRRWVTGLSLALLMGCQGQLDDQRPLRPRGLDPIECDGSPAVAAPLARLGRHEYEASLRALFGDGPVDAVGDALAGVPTEQSESEVPFARTDRRLSQQHIDAYYRTADALASQLGADRELRIRLAGDCAADGVDDACLRDFAGAFLRRALRHPPSDEELARALGAADGLEGFDRLHAVVFVTLMGPDFLYRFENRGAPESGRVIALTPHELASRLSYHFWGGPPDDALLAAAEDGSLATDEGYAAQVDRLLADPRTDAMLEVFFGEWLHLEGGELTDGPRLEVLRQGLETDGLTAEMRDEVHQLLRWHMERGDGWGDVLTSPYSFARDERLASIYGVPAWDGASEPPRLPEGERSGLITRAALLQTSDGSTNPFRRGAFLRRMVLCDRVDPPPSDLDPDALTPPPTAPGTTTREAFAAKVTNEPCASCHARFSPLGYAMEAYDGLGRYRAAEWLVSTEGVDHGMAPVDTAIVPEIEWGDLTPAEGPVEVSQRIADSPKANLCLVTQYFRFTHRREEHEDADLCLIEDLATRVEGGLSLEDALRAVALDPSFRLRRLERED